MQLKVPCSIWLKDEPSVGDLLHVDMEDVNTPLVVTGFLRVEDGWVVDVRELTEDEKLAASVMES